MNKGRLEAFSDGVLAIIITIMVLEIKVPHGQDFTALKPLFPVILSYILSFIYLGIYWNNHHHLLHSAGKINGNILWANLHLLFWLSLVPFTTGWMGENNFAPVPVALYGIMLLMCSIAYWILQHLIITHSGKESALAHAIGKDIKGKVSPFLYLTGIVLTFVNPWLSGLIYVLVAFMWLLPDRRIERIYETKG
ncbi:TMEM175 family protein [Rufibacter aurantiacus]|uniref:TMEM175 family protein n=1 Tax=Rufibacter aurantiacus TaxID=2817374 RepID=UPI001B309567|nr:TMEM175 family protein [Rufibacter aurantiacus]